MPLAVKKLPVSTGDVRDVDSIPGLGRSPGGGHACMWWKEPWNWSWFWSCCQPCVIQSNINILCFCVSLSQKWL